MKGSTKSLKSHNFDCFFNSLLYVYKMCGCKSWTNVHEYKTEFRVTDLNVNRKKNRKNILNEMAANQKTPESGRKSSLKDRSEKRNEHFWDVTFLQQLFCLSARRSSNSYPRKRVDGSEKRYLQVKIWQELHCLWQYIEFDRYNMEKRPIFLSDGSTCSSGCHFSVLSSIHSSVLLFINGLEGPQVRRQRKSRLNQSACVEGYQSSVSRTWRL